MLGSIFTWVTKSGLLLKVPTIKDYGSAEWISVNYYQVSFWDLPAVSATPADGLLLQSFHVLPRNLLWGSLLTCTKENITLSVSPPSLISLFRKDIRPFNVHLSSHDSKDNGEYKRNGNQGETRQWKETIQCSGELELVLYFTLGVSPIDTQKLLQIRCSEIACSH